MARALCEQLQLHECEQKIDRCLLGYWFTLSTEYCTSSFRQVGKAVFGKYLASQGSSLVLSNPGSMLYNIHH